MGPNNNGGAGKHGWYAIELEIEILVLQKNPGKAPTNPNIYKLNTTPNFSIYYLHMTWDSRVTLLNMVSLPFFN